MEQNKIRVIIIEDNLGDVMLIREILSSNEFDLDAFNDLDAGIKALEINNYDIALVDLGLPGCVGAEAPMMIINEFPSLPVIVLTGTENQRVITQLLRIGAQDYLIKGKFETETLIRSIRYSIERKKVSDDFLEQKNFAENVIDTAHAVVMVLDNSFNILRINKYFEDSTGYKAEDLKGRNWLNTFTSGKLKDEVSNTLRNAFKENFEQGHSYPLKDLKGRIMYIEWYYSTLKNQSGNIIGLLCIGQDVTKRKTTENKLHQTDEFLKKTQELSHVGTWVHDHRTNEMVWSEEVFNIYGADINSVKPSYEIMSGFVPEEDRDNFNMTYSASVKNGTSFEFFHSIFRSDGTERFLYQKAGQEKNSSGKVVRTMGMVHDITNQRELEEQLRQSQKMEAIGLLAGGIAHDFNNLLMVILCNCDLVLARTKNDDPLKEDIHEIKNSGKRAAELTRQLLAFSRKQVLKPQIIDINLVIGDLEKMINRLVGEKITLNTMLHPELGVVRSDRGQLDQVIMNLVVNARDAMPDGGKLTIETGNVHLDDEYIKKYSEIKPGNYVMMAVTDTGTGMSKEIVDKIFEPFFTTKGVGKGTGLGLSTVYGIIKQSNGYIYCYSEPGNGTTFKVYLPLIDEELLKNTESAEEEKGSINGEKIVIIDDEKEIRDVVKRMLEQEGFEVFVAENFQDVLNFYENNSIDLLITDVIMPEMNGDEIGDKILAKYPDAKIIYMSGYTESTIMDFSLLDKNKIYLQKPFSRQSIVHSVREILNI